eukprot:SAG25_NODE_2208_length_1835_cov_2.710829_1_plen_197_part_00
MQDLKVLNNKLQRKVEQLTTQLSMKHAEADGAVEAAATPAPCDTDYISGLVRKCAVSEECEVCLLKFNSLARHQMAVKHGHIYRARSKETGSAKKRRLNEERRDRHTRKRTLMHEMQAPSNPAVQQAIRRLALGQGSAGSDFREYLDTMPKRLKTEYIQSREQREWHEFQFTEDAIFSRPLVYRYKAAGGSGAANK